MARPFISALVPVANSVSMVEMSTAALMAGLRPFDSEVIFFVDGPVEAETLGILRRLADQPNARVELSPHRVGPNRANQVAASLASGEHLLFINTDAVLHPETLPALLRLLTAQADVGIAQAQLVYPQTGRIQSIGHTFGTYWNRHAMAGRRLAACAGLPSRECVGLTSALFLVRRAAFDDVGGLDPYFYDAYEGLDLALRVTASGWRCVVDLTAPSFHFQGLTRTTARRNEEQQTGYFWQRWGTKIRPDLPELLKLQLDKHDCSQAFIPLNFSDFNPWLDLARDAGIRVGTQLLLESRYKEKIVLPDLMSPRVQASPDRFIYFVNHFSNVTAHNLTWFADRPHRLDLVVDTHGNLVSPYDPDL